MKRIILSLFVLSIASQSWADQCQLLDRKTAKAAEQLLEKHAALFVLCEPCGEVAPREVKISPRNLFIVKIDSNEYEVRVKKSPKNLEYIDLAYTYIAAGDYKSSFLLNVGQILNCGATDVSTILPWDASKVECQDGACG